jgi:hypothetical protein
MFAVLSDTKAKQKNVKVKQKKPLSFIAENGLITRRLCRIRPVPSPW